MPVFGEDVVKLLHDLYLGCWHLDVSKIWDLQGHVPTTVPTPRRFLLPVLLLLLVLLLLQKMHVLVRRQHRRWHCDIAFLKALVDEASASFKA